VSGRAFELIVFDWDGTLMDSAGHIVRSIRRAVEALELPPRTDAQIPTRRPTVRCGVG